MVKDAWEWYWIGSGSKVKGFWQKLVILAVRWGLARGPEDCPLQVRAWCKQI